MDDNTSLSIYNKKKRSFCIIRKDLAKSYEIEVDASEAPVLNKMLSDPDPYESSVADLKILEDEVFPINNAFQKVFGADKELRLNSIKLAIGSNYNDYVTIGENDLIKFDIKPTLSGLMDFINENKEGILGFLDSEVRLLSSLFWGEAELPSIRELFLVLFREVSVLQQQLHLLLVWASSVQP